jgi:cytochrome b subunit of formate dehydrogenase
MKKKQIRGLLSTILMVCILVTSLTGVVLYFVPYGMWLCFTRKLLRDIHAVTALVMFITAAVHFILNEHTWCQEVKSLTKNDK